MDCSKDIILQNERISLHPMAKSHAEMLLKFVLEEPEIWTYSLKHLKTELDLKSYIQVGLDARAMGITYPFVVFDKSKQAFAGSTRFYNIDTTHKTAMLGYTWYGKEFQGTGLNKNAKYILLSYAFETLGFERIEFRADVNNARSIQAMKSIGCTLEGVLRSNFVIDDKRRDSVVLSILKEEWFAKIKQQLNDAIQ
ncbi:MAG: RimJ/RimL family protein N-acetyltransferase [Patiriisocius sp.]|jgi:RimJ/RimL family protein N-acetyltransferase